MIVAAFMDSGTLSGWLTVVAVLVGAFVIWRGGGGAALSTLKLANEVLATRVTELERLREIDAHTIGELRAKTDVTIALVPLVDGLTRHEERAEQRYELALARANERHAATLKLLDDIARKVADGNGT